MTLQCPKVLRPAARSLDSSKRRQWLHDKRFFHFVPRCLAAYVLVLAIILIPAAQARAAPATSPTNPSVQCRDRENQDFVMPPVLDSRAGILQGTIALVDEFHQIPHAVSAPGKTGEVTCITQLVRAFRGKTATGEKLVARGTNNDEPIPGPTLRARVGDLVQLSFINEVDSSRFAGSYGIEECDEVGQNGEIYPGRPDPPVGPQTRFDVHPNCLHASNTANIHFHGTHTNPNSTGDNVYNQILPLPRDNQGKLTTKPNDAKVGFNQYFENCARELRPAPVKSWPTTWEDLPKIWTAKQNGLLLDHEQKHQGSTSQPIWTENEKLRTAGIWPIYYVGAFPYCFALPAYTAGDWPPPRDSKSPMMGQAPGTHWYHAHKHGSTATNVMEGMAGAFIIEGKYDDDLNAAYGGYILEDDAGNMRAWNTRAQKVLVLNQFGVATGGTGTEGTPPGVLKPNILAGGATSPESGLDFAVNGRLGPRLKMQPGEVQLWRIINSSARSAAYFMVPDGLEWKQIAQDGVQFAFENYNNSYNKPFYMAPANRVDLLVKAPIARKEPYEVRVQNVLSRSSVRPTPISPTSDDPTPGTVLLHVAVEGRQPLLDNKEVDMRFLGNTLGEPKFPEQPKFLASIDEKIKELKQSNYIRR